MIRLTHCLALCICTVVLAAGHVAYAHNLFVLVEPQADGPDVVNVIFEHGPAPGKGNYNQPLLDRGETWIRQPGTDEAVPLELKETATQEKKFLQAETESKSPKVIVHKCTWGVYKGRLDHFYGKYLDVTSAEEAGRLAREQKIPLDIAPAVTADALTLTVYFEGEPLADTKVSIWSPSGKEWIQTTDSEGRTMLKKPRAGLYSVAVAHKLKDPSGEFNGESYKGVMHATSCSLRWPLK